MENNTSHDSLLRVQSSSSLREYGRYEKTIEAPTVRAVRQLIMEELGKINTRLKKINDEYSAVFENETTETTSAEEDFKAYLIRKKCNMYEREATMLKEVEELVDKISDRKIRKHLTIFLENYAAVMKALQGKSQEQQTILEDLSKWLTEDRLGLAGVRSTHILLAETAEEEMRANYTEIINTMEKLKNLKTEMDSFKFTVQKKSKKWKVAEPQRKVSADESVFEIQFQGMGWQELTSYMLNFARENFADSPEITRVITENITEMINIMKSREQEMERMKTDITAKSLLIGKLSKQKSLLEEKEAKGSEAYWRRASRSITKKGSNDEEQMPRIERSGIATISFGQLNVGPVKNERMSISEDYVPETLMRPVAKKSDDQNRKSTRDNSITTKVESALQETITEQMEQEEIQQLLRTHINTSIDHIKAISTELLRLRKAARRDIETIKSKEMDVHEVEQKLRELIPVVSSAPNSLPEVKKADAALIVQSRTPGTHTCAHCQCHNKNNKTTAVAKADSKTSMEEVKKHCSRYLQLVGATEKVFEKAFSLLKDIQLRLRFCQSQTMWKEGNLAELSILNPANDNEIMEQVNNAQDIPETTKDLIEHANNCFKLLQVFYKDLDSIIQLSKKCVAQVAEQDERVREMNTLLSFVKDIFDRTGLDMARLKFGENQLQTMDMLAGMVCPYCHCASEDWRSDDSAMEKPRPKQTLTKDELLSSLKKEDSVRAKVDLMVDALGAILKEVDENAGRQASESEEEEEQAREEAVEAMREAHSWLEKASQQAMRVELDGNEEGERAKRAKDQRLLVTRSPGEGKSLTGKELVSHASVTQVTELYSLPTKDKIRRKSTITVKEQKDTPTKWKDADGSKKTGSQRRQSKNFVSSPAATSDKNPLGAQVKGQRRRSKIPGSKAMPEDECTPKAEIGQEVGKEEGNVDIKVEVKGDPEFLDNPVETVADTQHDTDTTFSKANSGAATKRKSSVVARTDTVVKSKGKGQKKSTNVRRASDSPEVGGRRREAEDTHVTDGQSKSDSLDISQLSADMTSTQERLEKDRPEDKQEGFRKEKRRSEQPSMDGVREGKTARGVKVFPDSLACSSLPRDSSSVRQDLEKEIRPRYVEATFDDTLIPMREKREYDASHSEDLQSKLVETSREALTRKGKAGELGSKVKDIAAVMEKDCQESLVKSKQKLELKSYCRRGQLTTPYPPSSRTHGIKHQVRDMLAHQSSGPIKLTEYDRMRAMTKSPTPGSEVKESSVFATGLLRNLQPTCVGGEQDYYGWTPAKAKTKMNKSPRFPRSGTTPDQEGLMSFGMGIKPPSADPNDKYRKNTDVTLNLISDIAHLNLLSLVGHDSTSTCEIFGLASIPAKKPHRTSTLKRQALGTFSHDCFSSSKDESRGKIVDPHPGLATLTIAGARKASPDSYASKDTSLKIQKVQEAQPLPPLREKSLRSKSPFFSLPESQQANPVMGESDTWKLTRIPVTEADRKRAHTPHPPLCKDRMPSLSRSIQVPVRGSRLCPPMTSSEKSLLCLLYYCRSQGVAEEKLQSLLGCEGKLSLSSTFTTIPEFCLHALVPFIGGTFQYCQLGYSPHFTQALGGFIKENHKPKESSYKSLFSHLYKRPTFDLKKAGPHQYDLCLCVRNSAPYTYLKNYHPRTDQQLIMKHDPDVLSDKKWKCRGIRHTTDNPVSDMRLTPSVGLVGKPYFISSDCLFRAKD